MERTNNLLNGNIRNAIIKMALPLMGMAFIQMTYTMVDLIWLGRLSTDSVAAVGTAGFYMWLATSVTLITEVGMSVNLSQSHGRQDYDDIEKFTIAGFQVNTILCTILVMIYIIFRNPLFEFYKLAPSVEKLALQYHVIISAGLIFFFLNVFFSSIFFSQGNSSTPFKVLVMSLIFNIVADPVLIFGIGPFPKMGIRGAALATIMAQAIGTILYIYIGFKYDEYYIRLNYFVLSKFKYIKKNVLIGFPVAIQNFIHAIIGIKLNQFIAIFGSVGVATFAIGAQIESISWMTSDGFALSFTSFFGQNYGAKNFDRLKKAKGVAVKLMLIVGFIASMIMILGNDFLFKIFTPNDPEVIMEGSKYLIIMGITTSLMALEIGFTGMLNGLGLTKYHAIIGTIFNIMRIPLAYFLMKPLKLTGIWLTMSISSALKGIFMIGIFLYIEMKTNGFKDNMEKYI